MPRRPPGLQRPRGNGSAGERDIRMPGAGRSRRPGRSRSGRTCAAGTMEPPPASTPLSRSSPKPIPCDAHHARRLVEAAAALFPSLGTATYSTPRKVELIVAALMAARRQPSAVDHQPESGRGHPLSGACRQGPRAPAGDGSPRLRNSQAPRPQLTWRWQRPKSVRCRPRSDASPLRPRCTGALSGRPVSGIRPGVAVNETFP